MAELTNPLIATTRFCWVALFDLMRWVDDLNRFRIKKKVGYWANVPHLFLRVKCQLVWVSWAHQSQSSSFYASTGLLVLRMELCESEQQNEDSKWDFSLFQTLVYFFLAVKWTKTQVGESVSYTKPSGH